MSTSEVSKSLNLAVSVREASLVASLAVFSTRQITALEKSLDRMLLRWRQDQACQHATAAEQSHRESSLQSTLVAAFACNS